MDPELASRYPRPAAPGVRRERVLRDLDGTPVPVPRARKDEPVVRPDGTVVNRNARGLIPSDGSALANWNSKHQLILYAHVLGRKNVEIARSLELSEPWVCAVIGSPLFQQQKEALLAEFRAETFDHMLEKIRREAPVNFDKLVHLRDFDADSKVQLGAARAIQQEADRIWPRRIERSASDDGIRVSIPVEALSALTRAIAELKGGSGSIIDMEPVAEDAEIIAPVDVDSYINELAAEAATDG